MQEPDGKYQELFDPQKPLPEDVVLVHDRGSGTGASWVFLLLGGLLGLAVLNGLVRMVLDFPDKLNFDFWFGLAIGTGLSVGAWALFRKGLEYRRAMAEIAAGTYRYGLFLLNDRLLLRTRKAFEEWQIDDIVDIHHRRMQSFERAGNHSMELVLELRAGDGQLSEYIFREAFAEAQSSLVQLLHTWHNPRTRDWSVSKRLSVSKNQLRPGAYS